MDIHDFKPRFDKVIEHLHTELTNIRTNRATPSLIEHITVSAYEGSNPMPLVQLASITSPEARQLLVEPWDKSTLHAIEKTLSGNEIGLSVANEGTCLRLTLPLMTDEVKQKIIKILYQKLEEARIALRQQRDGIKEIILKQEKNKEISEDERYKLIERLDENIKEYNEKVKEIGEKKEQEIRG